LLNNEQKVEVCDPSLRSG